MTLLINLFAGPGSGKSTAAAGVFSLLKIHNVNCELVTEFAKDLCWEQRDVALKNQYYIFGKQYHKILRLIHQVEVAVTDSPLLFSLIYGKLLGNAPSFYETVESAHNTFNNMNFFLERVKEFNPSGRLQNEEEAKDLDRKIKEMLADVGIGYHTTVGDYEGVNQITEKILERLHKPLNYRIMKVRIGKI